MKQHKGNDTSTELMDEMAIVGVFTRLIFDPDAELDDTELLVVELLAQQEPGLSAATRRELSEHLRAMGVDEMITVVARIKQSIEQRGLLAATLNPANPYLYR